MRRPPPRLLAPLAVSAAVLLAPPALGQPPAPAQPAPPALPLQTPAPPTLRPPAPVEPELTEADGPHAACDRIGPAAFAFTEDDRFAPRMAAALRSRPETVTVNVSRPFAPETIPDRAHAWLVETARQGGAVRLRRIPCGGGAADPGEPLPFGVRAFFTRPGAGVAEAVRGYEAVLWIEQATGAVTQLQFVRRSR